MGNEDINKCLGEVIGQLQFVVRSMDSVDKRLNDDTKTIVAISTHLSQIDNTLKEMKDKSKEDSISIHDSISKLRKEIDEKIYGIYERVENHRMELDKKIKDTNSEVSKTKDDLIGSEIENKTESRKMKYALIQKIIDWIFKIAMAVVAGLYGYDKLSK